MSELDLEQLKRDSRGLRGTIAESLEDDTTGGISETNLPLLKFHGLYQQDDRDLRAERREARLEPLHSFMIRIRLRSEEHTSELQSRFDLVCRLLLEKKKIMVSENVDKQTRKIAPDDIVV